MQMIELKTIQPYFDAVWYGRKPFEIRFDDRKFAVGDILWLREYTPSQSDHVPGVYGRSIIAGITYLLPAGEFAGLAPGYCAIGIEILARKDLYGKVIP